MLLDRLCYGGTVHAAFISINKLIHKPLLLQAALLFIARRQIILAERLLNVNVIKIIVWLSLCANYQVFVSNPQASIRRLTNDRENVSPDTYTE